MSYQHICTNCNAKLNRQRGYDPNADTWTCTKCGALLFDPDVYHGELFEGVAWYCDHCGAFLNKQDGFTDLDGHWDCTECGYVNTISLDEIQENEVEKKEPAIVRVLNVLLDSPNHTVPYQESEFERFLEKAISALFKGIFWVIKMLGKLIFFVFKEIFNLLKKMVHYFIDPQKDGRISKKNFAQMRIKAFFCNRKLLPINNDCYDLLHKNVDKVKVILYNSGFKRIKAIPINDLGYQDKHRIGEVEQVVINGTSFFESGDMFPYNAQIIITYHEKRGRAR